MENRNKDFSTDSFLVEILFSKHTVISYWQVGTKGYAGLGFSPNGNMKGADIILGWVDAAGEVFIQVSSSLLLYLLTSLFFWQHQNYGIFCVVMQIFIWLIYSVSQP